jgi:hypothetical protein
MLAQALFNIRLYTGIFVLTRFESRHVVDDR